MSGDGTHSVLQHTRNAIMQRRCVWHRPALLVRMLRWVFTMRTETNKITIPPLRRLRFYCTLQSILRYHYTNARTSHTSTAAAASLPQQCTHLSYRTHAAPRTTPPAQTLASCTNPHQPAEHSARLTRFHCAAASDGAPTPKACENLVTSASMRAVAPGS